MWEEARNIPANHDCCQRATGSEERNEMKYEKISETGLSLRYVVVPVSNLISGAR